MTPKQLAEILDAMASGAMAAANIQRERRNGETEVMFRSLSHILDCGAVAARIEATKEDREPSHPFPPPPRVKR